MGLRAEILFGLKHAESIEEAEKINKALELSIEDRAKVCNLLCEMDKFIVEGKYRKARKTRIEIENIRENYRKEYSSLRVRADKISAEDERAIEGLKRQINRAKLDGDIAESDRLKFQIKEIRNKYVGK